MAISGLASVLPDLLLILPTLLYAMEIIFYLFFIWFYGTISMFGYKKHKSIATIMGGKVLTGVVCLVGGVSFAGFVPFLSKGFLHALQLDSFVAGFSASVALAFALYLITHKDARLTPSYSVDSLKRKIVVLEDMLRKRALSLPAANAIKKAEYALRGYKAAGSKLIGNEWEVELKKGEDVGKVIIDAWDGEIKKVKMKFSLSDFFKDAHKVLGLLMIILVIGASVLFFEGFPDPNETFASMFGITMDDITNMSAALRDNPFVTGELAPGCVSPLVFSRYQSQLQDKDFLLDHLYDDESTKSTVEMNSGDTVQIMLRLDHEGKDLILAITEKGKGCYLTDGTFCGCIDGQ
jgi:hypothetical protein